MTGAIPQELRNLRRLRHLDLNDNLLEGFVPAWLGASSDLAYLDLARNHLLGEIPPQLARLTRLQHLDLHRNFLTGRPPDGLGRLVELRHLDLGQNMLDGVIPAWLADLPRLQHLSLGANLFTGVVPPRLGGLRSLQHLDLARNQLVGTVPGELSELVALRHLALNDNALTGRLPASLTAFELTELHLGGTEICVESDDLPMKQWIRNISRLTSRIANCPNTEPVYLVQAVQSFETPTTLVAGRPALLRVFLASEAAAGMEVPAVEATFYDAQGTVLHEVEIAPGGTLQAEITEGRLEASANADIPGSVIQPGVEMAVEVRGNRPGLPRRIPARGRISLDVEEMPPLPLTVVPFLEEGSPDYTVIDVAQALREHGLAHPLLRTTNDLLPLNGLNLTVHEPVWASSVSGSALLGVVTAIRNAEGGTGYWLGMVGYADSRVAGVGVANVGGWTAVSEPDSHTIAHELGHAMNLWHAPCGGADRPDPWFPDPHAHIGSWGYDRRHGVLVPPHSRDIMSYCSPWWIGEFGFSKAAAFRLREEGPAPPETEPVLLLWGGVDRWGEPYLRPALLIDAVPSVPPLGEDYRISGRGSDGAAFSLTFDMPPQAGAPDEQVFVITLPVSWTGSIDTIRLEGGGKVAALDLGTSDPVTILRDSSTGQVRAVLEQPAAEAVNQLPGIALDVFESRAVAVP